MARLQITLLGGFQARLVPGDAIALPTRKAQALLAYLAMPPGRLHQRDKLSAMLWGDASESLARRSFRKALSWVKRSLADTEALIVQGEMVGLVAEVVVTDVGEFERRVGASASPAALSEATEIYRGDLLAGLVLEEAAFEEWLVGERERLRELSLEGLARLLAHQRESGDPNGAIQSAIKLLSIDPLQEAVHRALMRLYAQTGRRGAALRQYQACVGALERELRAQPEDETTALYQEILHSRHAMASDPEPSAPAPPVAAAPVAVAPVVASPPALVPSAAASHETPLVGRQHEIAQLGATLEQAWAGGRRLAVVFGEAGVGKSRLAGRLGELAIERGGHVLRGRCYESEQALPFSPWIDALRGAGLAARADVIGALNPVWRSELARLLPELAGGVVPPADPGDALRLFEAVAQALDALAQRAPLLVVLEDLHWADALSMRLGGFLGRRARTGPMLILGTSRDEELEAGGILHKLGDALAREGHLVRLPVSRLSRNDTAALTRELAAAHPERNLAAIEDEIWRVSEGNPYMVVETVRAVLEHDGAPSSAPMPAAVRELVAARLRTLSEPAKRLIDVAAVIGRRCEFALLQPASGLDENEAADGVEELVRRRIFEQASDGLEFTHDQIREAHLAEILAPRRAILHRRVARALEALHPNDLARYALALGTHYREAGDWEKAVVHLRQAGLVAASRYAGREAATCFEDALRAMDHLPDSRQAQEQRFELSLSRARTWYWFGHFDRALTGYREAERLAHALGDDRRLGQVLGSLVYFLASTGHYADATSAGERALAIAEKTADHSLGVWASIGLGRSYYATGEYERGAARTRALAESMREAELDEHLRPGALRPSVGCRTWLALCLERLGEFDESLRWAEDALRIADGSDSLQAQVWASYTVGHVRLGRGDAEGAIPPLEHALALCGKGELPIYRPRVLGALGHAHALVGKVDAGLALIDEALEDTRAEQMVYGATSLLVAQAEVLIAGERYDDAADVARETLPGARERGERGDEAGLAAVLGLVALRGGDGDAAAQLERAVQLARQLQMRPLEARALAGLGEAQLALGRDAEAKRHLADAIAQFRALGMLRWLAPAEALRAKAG